MNLQEHIIQYNEPISNVLTKLNSPNHLRTVFVLDDNSKVLGTITDGDIRRGILKEIKVSEPCEKLAFTNFKFLKQGSISVFDLKKWKSNGINVLPLLNEYHELISILNFNELKSYLPISAVIMAGGLGSRLRPLTNNTPKPMLKIGDLPILEIGIRRLLSYGITDITICVNYLKEQIIEYFGNGDKFGCTIKYIHEDKPLGTIGALSLITEIQNDTILLFNADLLSNIDFEEMLLNHLETNSDLTIASTMYKVTLPYAILETSNHQIKNLAEKPTYTYFANAGFYLFQKSSLELIPKDIFYNATDFAEDLVENQKNVISFPIHGYWNDIGSIDDFQKSIEDFKTINFF
jgi:hypothetical protein